MAKKSEIKQLIDKHQQLTHSEHQKVVSHVQREHEDWYINTLMLENVTVPFKYKRKKLYQSLRGQRINLTYYPSTENVAGFDIEVMNVVRIKVS